MASNNAQTSESSVVDSMVALSLDVKCDSQPTGQLEQPSGPESEVATKAVSLSDKLYKIVNSLAEKMQSFSKTSDKADSAAEEMGNILASWNEDFVKLTSHEHALLSKHIASTPGVLNSFLSLADTLLPELGQKRQWFKCFGELNRCFAMWSSTTPLMQQKLVKEGIVSGIVYELEVYKDSPTSELLMFLIQLALSILCDCLQVPSNVPLYMNTECSKIVQYFTKSTDSEIRVSSIFVLSYIESKLTADQRHHLQLQSQDVQFVIDMLLESISTDSTFSSPIPLLKGLQNAVKAERGNAQTLVSQGIFSAASHTLATDNSDVQRETILLLWILACIPTYADKFSDLVHALQRLQGSSDSKLALASMCVLWDITGGRKTDFEAYTAFAQGCYQFGMYKRCIAACAEMLQASTCSSTGIQKVKLLKSKSLFHVYNKAVNELPVEVSPKDYSTRQKLAACIEQATEVVHLLGSAHDHHFIDEEGSKYLDLSMMYLISSENALKRCERCLLCLKNLRLGKKTDEEQQGATGGAMPQSSKRYKGLQHSHVWPKAIFDAFSSGMKKTSSRRLFRLSGTSLTQLKSPKEVTWFILCKECEQLVGNVEEQFIRNFFKKIYDVTSPSKPLEAQEIMYGRWLYQFCISIFLRGVAVLPGNESFKRFHNADKLYEVFKMCREILLKPTNTHSVQPSVHLLINPTLPTSEEIRLFSTIHEVLVSPAFLALAAGKDPKTFFRTPPEACLFVAHIGILNVVIDIESVIPSHSHSINPREGEYHVPHESERSQFIPQEMKTVFYAAAHQIEVHQTTMSEKLHNSPWLKGLVESPPIQNEETFLIHQAQECDQKSLLQQGVRPSQDPSHAKVMNFLPRGFKIARLKTNSGIVQLLPGHRILLHCEVRDTDSSYDKGTTIFLAIGDGSKKYPSDRPYVIYHQYDPGMYINVGMFVSADDLSVTEVLADDKPTQYARAMCENPNFQENIYFTLMTVLYLTGFSSFKSFLPHTDDKRVHLKCLTRRRCWYCEDRCENCMEPAAIGLTEQAEDVILKFCSEECRVSFRSNPKVLNLLPATFKISINDGRVTVLPPPCHTTLQRVLDFVYDHEEELTASRTIHICVGDGSAEFPKDKLYVIYHRSTVLRQTLAACFVSDDLSLNPMPLPPQECDAELAESFVNFLNSKKTVESMLQAVLSDSGFTSLPAWWQYKRSEVGIDEAL